MFIGINNLFLLNLEKLAQAEISKISPHGCGGKKQPVRKKWFRNITFDGFLQVIQQWILKRLLFHASFYSPKGNCWGSLISDGEKMGTFVLWKKGRSPSLLLVAEYGKNHSVSGICCANVTCWFCGTDQNVFVIKTDDLFVPRMTGCVNPPPAAMFNTADIWRMHPERNKKMAFIVKSVCWTQDSHTHG